MPRAWLAVGLLLLAGCGPSEIAPSAAASSTPVVAPRQLVCAVQQDGGGGLLTNLPTSEPISYAEQGLVVERLEPSSCAAQPHPRQACDRGFPWVVAIADVYVGSLGARLWAQAELTSGWADGERHLRQSVVAFSATPDVGMITLEDDTRACGLTAGPDATLTGHLGDADVVVTEQGRVLLALEFSGDWTDADIDQVRALATAAAQRDVEA